MKLIIRYWFTSGALLYNLLALSPSQAQIVPDATLPNNSNVTEKDNISTITGGTKAGANLFHSFEQFSIPTGSEAYFNNYSDIQNIFSRVTGGFVSNIDGTIKANGTANLFLLNSNGIIFGPNAQMNIGGSFLASTASSINFADGMQFVAKNNQTTPLLTVSVPTGLGFGGNPGAIRVLGEGNNVVASSYQPIIRGNNSTAGLKVQPQQTLAIVGGDVSLEGGILTADSGRIELGSVDNGLVSFSPTTSGWSLGYEGVVTFKDIGLTQRALVDASGLGSGSIQIQGRKLQLSDGSLVLIQNQGLLPTGTLKVNASESLEIRDIDQIRKVYSGIWSETLGFGDGGEIAVSTPELTVRSSGQIFSGTFGAAKAANITLSVSKSLQVISLLSTEVGGGVIVGSLAIGSGQAGDITISAGQLNVANGGLILTANVTPVTSSAAAGGSGDINISASDIEVNGTAPNLSIPSAVSAATFSTGKAGNVTISTSRLRVRNGGRVDSSTTAFGTAGSVTINASDLVEVGGVAPGSRVPSLVTSAATILDQSLQDTFRLFGDPIGVSGKVSINTRQLTVKDGGQLSVRNEGKTGSAGSLQINANSINLNNEGGITAATASGQGGEISLRAQNLQLRNNSAITTNAGGKGNGGNITIGTSTLTALENSDITANAFEGQGGNIQINTQGLFLSPDSKITASSKLGLQYSGIVLINTPDLDFSRATVQPVVEPESPEVASVCQGRSGIASSKLIDTGVGGVPASPSDFLFSDTGWRDNSLSTQVTQNPRGPERSTTDKSMQIVEAQGWKRNSNGTVSMTTEATETVPYSSLATLFCSTDDSTVVNVENFRR